MPPNQPVHKCASCGHYRPCKRFDGEWLCVEHAPVQPARTAAHGPAGRVATDGGET